MVTCPRPPVFARPNILVASFATQAIVASFATQARVCILSDHNIFYTPREGGNGGVMPLGLFLLPYNYPQEIVLGPFYFHQRLLDICQWCEYLIFNMKIMTFIEKSCKL